MKTLFPLLLISLLFGCKQPVKQNIVNEKPQSPKDIVYITSKSDRIIFTDNFYTPYLKALRTGIKNRDSLYRNIIYRSVSEREFRHLIGGSYRVVTDTAFLVNYISSSKGSQEKVKELIALALHDANKILKNDSNTFFVNSFVKYPKIEKMGGVDIFSLGGNMQMNFNIDTTVGNWKEMLKYCVARDYFLSYWIKRKSNKYPKCLLDFLILNGSADFFANLIYPGVKCPWTDALKTNNEARLWRKIKPDLQSEEARLPYEIIDGYTPNPLLRGYIPYPLWGGYTLGYHIVQSALKNHPELTPEQWTNLSPEKILEMSDYK
ncbi:MAG TPA: DUF2268 domain-containing putative Zn-dependent protease [Bacteroidia bacterium]|jgi:hypothetical protein|nr:DUF2268 domain-containing putative Zn-dependent protease [Bacteroidia bacterium]